MSSGECRVRRASSKRYVVLEGNRRVAALKLLLSPSLAPETSRSRIEKIANILTDDQKESFSEIAAVIAPSREAANPIIADRHTSPPVESWRPIMQARFFYNMLEEQSPKSITDEFKITPGDLASAPTHSEDTGSRSILARIVSWDLVQTKGFGSWLCCST